MHAQDIYVRVNISNMEMCSSSDSPQIDVIPFSFTMALAAAVSGTIRVLCSYDYVIKNGTIVSL